MSKAYLSTVCQGLLWPRKLDIKMENTPQYVQLKSAKAQSAGLEGGHLDSASDFSSGDYKYQQQSS